MMTKEYDIIDRYIPVVIDWIPIAYEEHGG